MKPQPGTWTERAFRGRNRGPSHQPAAPIHPPANIPDHELLRLIGRGSYGEVWLARNIMGTYRAVKIVRREAFDSERPYLREFAGVRRCEPISRAHDGLIDILHIGQNEENGFFYYVMELADPAGGSFSEETYQPATLAELNAQPGRLTATECLRLAESMAGALAFLHEQGLIHRDVKPSNILLCAGVPKLADIGLVSATGSSRSFVGTEGFVPLEGPGTERADLFALGKVLYESLTGLDRKQFPQLPEGWRESPDFSQRMELNEIVLRACEGRLTEGYPNARGLLADVTLLASGKSVRKMRGMESRLRVLKWAAAAAALLALLGAGTAWVLRREQLRDQALATTRRDSQYAALTAAIKSAQLDPRPGAASTALRVVGEAARLQPTDALRDDAIVLLNRPDFIHRPDLAVPVPMPGAQYPAVDARHGLVAVMPQGGTDLSGQLLIDIYPAGSAVPLRRLVIAQAPPAVIHLEFSADGHRLAILGGDGGGMVLDAASGDPLATFPGDQAVVSLTVFCGPSGHRLIRRMVHGGLEILTIPDKPTGTPPAAAGHTLTPPLKNWPVPAGPAGQRTLWPSPDGSRVLLIHAAGSPRKTLPGWLPGALNPLPDSDRHGACLTETGSGKIIWQAAGPDEYTAAWSADGSRIAVRCGEAIRVLEAASGQTLFTLPRRIINSGTQLCFPGSRDLLAFNTWSEGGLYDLPRGELVSRLPIGGILHYDATSRLLYSVTREAMPGAVECRPSPVLRVLPAMGSVRQPTAFSFDPNEKWLIVGCDSAFHWWRLDATLDQPDKVQPAPGASLVIFRRNGIAEFLTAAGISRLPWTGQPPEALPEPVAPQGFPGRPINFATTSADGSVRAYAAGPTIRVERDDTDARLIETGDSGSPVALSPDGRWLAIGNHHTPEFRLMDLSGKDLIPAWRDAAAPACGIFSPDGRSFVRSGPLGHVVMRLDAEKNSWQPERTLHGLNPSLIPRASATAAQQGPARDLMTLKRDGSCVAIVDPHTWQTLFHLRSPVEELFEQCTVSPSGRWFAAVGTRQEIYLWDLAALARELTSLGLPPP